MYKASRLKNRQSTVKEIPNPLFLFDVEQLTDPSQKEQMRMDLSNFLELDTPLPPMEVHAKPGRSWNVHRNVQSMKDALKIDICDQQYWIVRNELMRIARSNSIWLRRFLLDPEVMEKHQVHVSSEKLLKEILKGWMKDPCNTTDATASAGESVLREFFDHNEIQ